MVKFKTMTEDEYEDYYNFAIKNYAREKIEAGNWSEEDAEEKSRKIFNKLLPDGTDTENHYLFSIYDNENHIGYIWFRVMEENNNIAFLNDIVIFEEYRGKGYGKETMKLLEKKVGELDCSKIQLHVFGHNEVAVSLYKKLNYEVTNYRMEKDINR